MSDLKVVKSSELVKELITRIKEMRIDVDDLDELMDLLEEGVYDSIPAKTLEDTMKKDWLIEHWSEFSSFDLDNFFKHKK